MTDLSKWNRTEDGLPKFGAPCYLLGPYVRSEHGPMIGYRERLPDGAWCWETGLHSVSQTMFTHWLRIPTPEEILTDGRARDALVEIRSDILARLEDLGHERMATDLQLYIDAAIGPES